MRSLFDQSVENQSTMDAFESLIFLMGVLFVLNQSVRSVEALAAYFTLVLFNIEMLVHMISHQMTLHRAVGTV